MVKYIKHDNRSSGTYQIGVCVLDIMSGLLYNIRVCMDVQSNSIPLFSINIVCVQLKNHYNKSILSSQRNMIFMLQYTFHKSQSMVVYRECKA